MRPCMRNSSQTGAKPMHCPVIIKRAFPWAIWTDVGLLVRALKTTQILSGFGIQEKVSNSRFSQMKFDISFIFSIDVFYYVNNWKSKNTLVTNSI